MTKTPGEEATTPDESDPVEPSDQGTEATELTEAAEAKEVTEADEADEADTADTADEVTGDEVDTADEVTGQKVDWVRVVAYGVLPALALILALVAGWLKFLDDSASDVTTARTDTVQVAKDSTAALLSYQPNTVEQQLTDARKLLTGQFLDSYTSLTTDVVIPGAKQKQISAVANVPAAASVSADQNHAVVLVFVDQTVAIGGDAPTATASTVRVTLDKIGDKWLISKFEPV